VLWQADPTARRPAVTLPVSICGALRSLPPVDRMQLVLPVAARADRQVDDRDAAHRVAVGLRIVGLLAAAATLRPLRRGRAIAAHLASAWRSTDGGTAAAIDAALVLCADHELNASTFAVRVAASAGSSPYDAVLAGLCTLRGSHHGGLTDRLEALIDEAGSPRRFRSVLERRLRRQQVIPGFGHPLYPDGDPRARLLRELAAASPRGADWAEAFTRAGADVVGDHPTLDAGLVLLRRALGLPRGAAFQLFAIGLSAGWIAHAMEQYQSGQLIRPRAVYPRDPSER
jgi:citrate synthase